MLSALRRCVTRWAVAGGLAMLVGSAHAVTLYSFGPGAGFANGFTPLSSTTGQQAGAVVTLGNGTQAFNGGITFHGTTGLFYAVANDSNAGSSLVSFSLSNPAATTVVNAALGTGFYGGLASTGSTLFALAATLQGQAQLYGVNPSNGSAQLLASLPFGEPAGLTFNASDGHLYAIGSDSLGSYTLERIVFDGTGWSSTPLFALGSGAVGFNGGLSFDGGSNQFLVIGNTVGGSALYGFSLASPAPVAIGGVFGQGFVNAGLTAAVPEPTGLLLFGLGLAVVAGWSVRRLAFVNSTSPH